MNKKFKKTLRKDLTVRRSGFLGLGRKVTVSNGSLGYTVDRRNANAETAEYLNSKFPTQTIRAPHL